MKPIHSLRNFYGGRKIYILGSGKSLDFIDPNFFREEITIGLNQVYKKYPDICFTVATHHAAVSNAIANDQNVLASHWDLAAFCDAKNENKFNAEYHIFETGLPENILNSIEEMSIDSDEIVLGETVVISAIHLAAYLGASSIILCGCDFGAFNGEFNFSGYYSKDPEHHNKKDQENLSNYGRGILPILKKRIKEVYGCDVYSLNPFTNPSFDGNVYSISENQTAKEETK